VVLPRRACGRTPPLLRRCARGPTPLWVLAEGEAADVFEGEAEQEVLEVYGRAVGGSVAQDGQQATVDGARHPSPSHSCMSSACSTSPERRRRSSCGRRCHARVRERSGEDKAACEMGEKGKDKVGRRWRSGAEGGVGLTILRPANSVVAFRSTRIVTT
jgi:hypothetical protein